MKCKKVGDIIRKKWKKNVLKIFTFVFKSWSEWVLCWGSWSTAASANQHAVPVMSVSPRLSLTVNRNPPNLNSQHSLGGYQTVAHQVWEQELSLATVAASATTRAPPVVTSHFTLHNGTSHYSTPVQVTGQHLYLIAKLTHARPVTEDAQPCWNLSRFSFTGRHSPPLRPRLFRFLVLRGTLHRIHFLKFVLFSGWLGTKYGSHGSLCFYMYVCVCVLFWKEGS